jgi:hypothetical protein
MILINLGQGLTLQNVKKAAGVRETDLRVSMLQAFKQDLDVRFALGNRALDPF